VRYAITDEIWAVMRPMIERCKSLFGPEPELPDRMFFEAVLYSARVGCPWRDLPSEFGDWSAVYNRLPAAFEYEGQTGGGGGLGRARHGDSSSVSMLIEIRSTMLRVTLRRRRS
jgi:transposase